MKSPEICRVAGVTYRQLDYWQRMGRLSLDGSVLGRGSGNVVNWTFDQAVLVRAYLITVNVGSGGHNTAGSGVRIDSRFKSIPRQLAIALAVDPYLNNYWLVVEANSAHIVRGDWNTDAALFVNLHACVAHVQSQLETVDAS
jgi:hypothetical protein